jgi:muramoyltetrapeptide carboxypeptidase LdcA involved in peptidoglycan recycling
MRLGGVLGRARALVFGEMRGCDEPGGAVSARAAVEDATAGFPGPIVYGFPSGHTAGPCWTLPFGVGVRIVTARRPAVIVEDAPVA